MVLGQFAHNSLYAEGLPSPIEVTVLFFGMLKDLTGVSQEKFALSSDATLDDVWQRCASRYPGLESAKPHTRLALNREFAELDARLGDGDEIAFLPPVSGGSELKGIYQLTRQTIDARELERFAQTASDGAVVTFEGVVRDNTNGNPTEFLEYECYESMALKMMEELGAYLQAKHKIGRLAIVHRLGRLSVGEASVVIVVAAPHRKPAFEACLEGINRLKSSVPIWKREHFASGTVWVDGAWDENAVPS